MSQLEQRLEAGFAPAWRPDKEDAAVLIGEVVEISKRETEYGVYPIVTVRQEDGTEKAIHALHSVLKNELIRQRPQPGEKIGVRYNGFVATPDGKFKGYESYTVKIEREAKEFDWSRIGVAEDDDFLEGVKTEPETTPTPDMTTPTDAGEDSIPF